MLLTEQGAVCTPVCRNTASD